MKYKITLLLALLLAGVMLFAACGKQAEDPADQLHFADLTDSTVLVEGQKYQGEVLEIPMVTKDGKMVAQIGAFAFFQLENLKTVTIPSSISSIQASAFEGCTGITELEIPSGVERIFPEAFQNCTGLSALILPSSLCNISDEAFAGCSALTEITFRGTTEQWSEISISPRWIEQGKQMTIHCTDGDIVTE